MAKSEYSVDHIDPQWKEGRDYQLVCGLDVLVNLRVEDNDINIRKSNMFVPYRIDDRIPVHQQPGDCGFFLVGGEWKLTQFMGGEWWQESKKIAKTISTYTYDAEQIPDWKTAKSLLNEKGKQ